MTSTEKTAGASRLASLRFRIPDSVLLRRVDSELVVFDSASNRYFVLDEMGERIWARLQENGALGALYDELLSGYDVEPEVLERDVTRFVEELSALGLIEVRG